MAPSGDGEMMRHAIAMMWREGDGVALGGQSEVISFARVAAVPAAVPEPGMLGAFGLAVAFLVASRRRGAG